MGREVSTRRCGNTRRVLGSGRTTTIVAQTALFALAIMAVPTVMAILKQWGWW